MNDVTVVYDNGIRAVNKASLRVDEGEFVFLVGASGSGKTTIIKLLTAEVRPTEGKVLVNNYNIGEMKKSRIPYLRRTLGVVYQDFRLIKTKTVYENVAFAMRTIGAKSKAIKQRVPYVLDLVGLADKAKEKPMNLSGGEQQRVAIARALANDPNVLLCDEATSALDPQTTKAILRLLKDLNEKLGITVVIITHEMAVVKEICDRVTVMEHGRVVEQGEVFNVFADPRQEITRSFIHTTSNLRKIEELIEEDSPVVQLKPGELIVRLSYIQRNVSEPLISTVSRKFDITLNIIFSDIAIVQNAPIGGTVAIISGEREQITQAIAYLSEKNVGVEVIKDARVSE